jgi:hypothetical protein
MLTGRHALELGVALPQPLGYGRFGLLSAVAIAAVAVFALAGAGETATATATATAPATATEVAHATVAPAVGKPPSSAPAW